MADEEVPKQIAGDSPDKEEKPETAQEPTDTATGEGNDASPTTQPDPVPAEEESAATAAAAEVQSPEEGGKKDREQDGEKGQEEGGEKGQEEGGVTDKVEDGETDKVEGGETDKVEGGETDNVEGGETDNVEGGETDKDEQKGDGETDKDEQKGDGETEPKSEEAEEGSEKLSEKAASTEGSQAPSGTATPAKEGEEKEGDVVPEDKEIESKSDTKEVWSESCTTEGDGQVTEVHTMPEGEDGEIGVVKSEGSIKSRTEEEPLEEIDIISDFVEKVSQAMSIPHSGPRKSQASAIADEEAEARYQARQALIAKYHAALTVREVIVKENLEVQNKIALYLRKNKVEDRADPQHKNLYDQEQRYVRFMAQVDVLNEKLVENQAKDGVQAEAVREQAMVWRHKADLEQQVIVDRKRHVALNSTFSRSGKPLSSLDVDQYIMVNNKKDAEVIALRLENIKLKYKITKKEKVLRSKEELAKGLHLIDFEQLKVENQSLNEKIEERNEELRKLSVKIAQTVQVLTHLKEKLQFVKGENRIQTASLQEVESRASKKRDILTRTKKTRDSLRIDNIRLRKNSGLLSYHELLRDYEEREDEHSNLSARLGQLQSKHAELTLNCKQVRRKIEWLQSSISEETV